MVCLRSGREETHPDDLLQPWSMAAPARSGSRSQERRISVPYKARWRRIHRSATSSSSSFTRATILLIRWTWRIPTSQRTHDVPAGCMFLFCFSLSSIPNSIASQIVCVDCMVWLERKIRWFHHSPEVTLLHFWCFFLYLNFWILYECESLAAKIKVQGSCAIHMLCCLLPWTTRVSCRLFVVWARQYFRTTIMLAGVCCANHRTIF